MAISLTEGDLRRAFPRARDSYIEAILSERKFLEEYGLLDNPLRWCHFCGQIGAETDGLRIVREDMRYSAGRIVEIFGPRRHSAKVGSSEAQRLAYQPFALAERVYGLGNPSMARRLGNTQVGDGYNFRGWGPGQVTGRGQSVKYAADLGVDIDAKPEALEDPAIGLKAFILEWDHRKLNDWADRNQGDAVSKGVNLGNPKHSATPNGLSDRRAWFRKAWTLWRDADENAVYAPPDEIKDLVLRLGDEGGQVRILQETLKRLGYNIGRVDSDFGPETRRAVFAFQGDRALDVDGIVGPATWAALKSAEPIERGNRELITAGDLKESGSRQIETAEAQQALGINAGLVGSLSVGSSLAFPGTVAAIPAWISTIRAFNDEMTDALHWVATPSGALACFGVVAVIYGLSVFSKGKKAEEIRVDEARTGANLSK